MKNTYTFTAAMIILAFSTKILAEFIHEILGHASFILLFGGRIIDIDIKLTWPLEVSHVTWEGDFMPWQVNLILAGGILVCLAFFIVLQTLLLLRRTKNWLWQSALFWLAFWNFLNPAGYLVIGGIKPFGDVAALIARGLLNQQASLILGILIFLPSFVALSATWLTLLSEANALENGGRSRFSLFLMWMTIPIVTAAYCIGSQQPLTNLLIFVSLSFLPGLAAITLASLWHDS